MSRIGITVRWLEWVFLSGIFVLLAACATSRQGKDLPENGSEAAQAEEENKRISIIALDDELKVGDGLLPSSIILPQSYINEDWLQVGGNGLHNMQHLEIPDSLMLAWKKKAGAGSSRHGRVLAQPVSANGLIFIMDGDNVIHAFDAQSGAQRWQQKLRVKRRPRTRRARTGLFERIRNPLSFFDTGGKDKESVGGGLAFANGRLFATSGLGVIAAIDPYNGNLIWVTETRTPIHSAPSVDDSRLFAVSDDNELFAINTQNGEVIWTYQSITETARMLTVPSPAVIDDVVVATFSSGEIVALQTLNGVVLWQDALSGSGLLTPLSSLNDIASGPIIADGYVIVSAQSGLTNAYDLRTGQRIWSQPTGTVGFPWVVDDFLYLVTTEGQVVCMHKLDGQIIWITSLALFKNPKKRKKRIAWNGPVLAGGRLLLTNSYGSFVEMDPVSGEIIRISDIEEKIFVSPIVIDETVYILTNKAQLMAFR